MKESVTIIDTKNVKDEIIQKINATKLYVYA